MNLKSLVLLAAFAPALLCAQVKVHSDRWMPLNGSANEEPAGYAIELLVEVFGDVHYTMLPWQESLSNVTKGKADAVIGAAKDEAPDLVFPSEPVAHVDYGVFTLADHPFVYSPETLKSARWAVIKGYSYWPALDALVAAGAPNVTVFGGANALADAVEALHEGRIDLFPESKPVFAWAVQEQEYSVDSFTSCHSEDGGFIYVAFTKDAHGQELALRWDTQIAALRASDKLPAILARYNVPDWK